MRARLVFENTELIHGIVAIPGYGCADWLLRRWYTQSVVGITACFSIAFFAIPASMLTWGFEAEAERLFNKAVERRRL